MHEPAFDLEFLTAATLPAARSELAGLLIACVHGGASIGFLAPLTPVEANAYWDVVRRQVESGSRSVIVARDAGRGRSIVGSGQLAFESKQTGRHRAEVCKVMVLPAYRRRGVAAAVMHDLERHARERLIRLVFLDTSEGPGGARGFYERLGYTYAGGIPDYALDPDGTEQKNAIYYKLLK